MCFDHAEQVGHVCSLTDHIHPDLGEQSCQSLAEERGVVGDDYPHGMLTTMRVPLSGALSMGAGEYVSVSSQRELLRASAPSPHSGPALSRIDLDENEVALVFRARGMDEAEADRAAAELLRRPEAPLLPSNDVDVEAVGTPLGVAASSFGFFAAGALIPILPFLLGLIGAAAIALAAALVGIALLASGAVVGLLSGAAMLRRALRQLAIGYGAAAVTVLLGLAFNAATS